MDQAGFAALDLLIGTIGHAADPKLGFVPRLCRGFRRAESLEKRQGLGGVAGAERGAGAGVFA
jgi:hypothetical protein